MTGSYDPLLVALSYVIAAVASYVALNLASRVSLAQARTRTYWLMGGAVALGTGIWSTHFIGMLAFHLPIAMAYDVPATLLSMLIAMLVSAFALFTVSRATLTLRRLVASGTLTGAGIASMHYAGMAAIQVLPAIRYDFSLVAVSILVAIAASIAVLRVAFSLRSDDVAHIVRKRILGALVMGAAIVCIHYTGMAAANFAEGSIGLGSAPNISSAWLAATVAGCTVLLLTATMLMRGDETPRIRGQTFGIRLKLAASYLLVSVLVASSSLAALWVQLESAERVAVLEAEAVANVIVDSFGNDALAIPKTLQRAVANIHRHEQRDTFVVDRAKRIVADADPEEVGSVFSRDADDAIGRTLADGRPRTFVEPHAATRPDFMQVVVALHTIPADHRSPIVGALVLEYTPIYDALLARARAVAYLIAAMGAAFVLFTAALGLRVASTIASPLAELQMGAAALAAGQYDARVKVRSSDEIGALAKAFNRMAEDLSVSHASLVEHQRELESRVAQRTMEWQRAEEAQRESAAEVRLIAEHMPAALCYVDKDLRYRYHNRQFARKFDVDDATVDGRTVPDIMGAEDYETIRGWVAEALSGREVTYERRHVRAGGDHQNVLTTLVPRRSEDGSVIGYYAMTQDISARKLAEEALRHTNTELTQANLQLREAQSQLLQAEKMASVGQLASGVAHEINNPVGYVHSNLGTLERYVVDIFTLLTRYQDAEASISDDAVRSKLVAAREAADLEFVSEDVLLLLAQSKDGLTRVTKIVRDLKNFSRSANDEKWQWADLHKGIDTALSIVWNEVKYKAHVNKDYGKLPLVQCHPSQLDQVFMNMLVNGAHAIAQHGTISIRTGTEGQGVWIEFTDTGEGIKPEHLKRIFDPFFTTKPVGKGTGLGLSVSYGIVEAHHGRIDVRTAVGKGTSLRVWLPVRQPGVDQPPAAPEAGHHEGPSTEAEDASPQLVAVEVERP